MSIPKSREQYLVGRDAEIKTAVDAALAGDHARVLIHGLPGVGKDVVAVEAVLDCKIKLNPQLTVQAWLQGSTEEIFLRQLVRLFATQHPKVVRGLESTQLAALLKIREWLAANPSCWLFVIEDANVNCTSIWSCLPPSAGRVIFTSVEDLRSVPLVEIDDGMPVHLGIADTVELAPLSTEHSIEMWRKMNLFALKLPEVDLNESEADLEARCNAALAAGGDHDALKYTAPPTTPTEKANAKKQRHRELQGALRAHTELSHRNLREFLEQGLGNLPLAVALNGHIVRDVGSVAGLIGRFKTAKLAQIDRDGRNPVTDRHLLGLDASVRVAVDRMKADPSLPEAEKKAAMRLLVIMAVLPGNETPTELLRGDGMFAPNTLIKPVNLRAQDGGEDHVTSDEMLDNAVTRLRQHGLLQRSGGGSRLVGNMHQLVQRSVRERVNRNDSVGDDAEAVAVLRATLRDQFFNKRPTNNAERQWLRELAPCVQHLWGVLTDRAGAGPPRMLDRTRGDSDLIPVARTATP